MCFSTIGLRGICYFLLHQCFDRWFNIALKYGRIQATERPIIFLDKFFHSWLWQTVATEGGAWAIDGLLRDLEALWRGSVNESGMDLSSEKFHFIDQMTVRLSFW
jgi:hypothetical protein